MGAEQVYFIRCPSQGLIKIGRTADPGRRFRQLRTFNAAPLEPMGLIGGGTELERSLHERFRPDWSHGEWFRESPELLAYIGANAEPWKGPGEPKPRQIIADPVPAKEPLKQWAERTMLTVDGETRTIAEWAEYKKCSCFQIKCYLKRHGQPSNASVKWRWMGSFTSRYWSDTPH